jgi:outer membrane protein OmpA-like peptidoglycan-associated protein
VIALIPMDIGSRDTVRYGGNECRRLLDSAMKTLATRLILFTLASLPATMAYAQTGTWYVSPAIVYTDDDPDRVLDDSVAGGQIHVGRHMSEHYTLEGLFGYSNIHGYPGYPDQADMDISANLLAFYDRDAGFAPYALVGLGYLGTDYKPGSSESRPSGTAGLGFVWTFGRGIYSLRSEVRTRHAYKSGSNFHDWLASVGVQYNFGAAGRAKSTRTYSDSDRDGVLDIWDECPQTPPGTDVGANGCPLRDRAPDSDGDGVPDVRDVCPATPPGVPVTPSGCSLDSDNDGVTSDKDRCPSTSPGAVVDEFGCARDDDNDGVPDHVDRCPNTVPGSRVDVSGCAIQDIIRLPGVNFQTGANIILPGAEPVLQAAAATLNLYPDVQVEVAGHTDSVGEESRNLELSEQRAETVRQLLIRFGVAEDRLTAVGYGESQPIQDNVTSVGRAANRRVELRIKE